MARGASNLSTACYTQIYSLRIPETLISPQPCYHLPPSISMSCSKATSNKESPTSACTPQISRFDKYTNSPIITYINGFFVAVRVHKCQLHSAKRARKVLRSTRQQRRHWTSCAERSRPQCMPQQTMRHCLCLQTHARQQLCFIQAHESNTLQDLQKSLGLILIDYSRSIRNVWDLFAVGPRFEVGDYDVRG